MPIRELSFTWMIMWVQIHDILFHYLNRRVAEEICEVVRAVDRTTSTDEMEGGNFMRVRVSINISLPLCHGRIITLEDGGEVWVKFRYERLLNICYWCECLTHSDRDCEVWINSDGTLKAGDQEYGPWLQAPFTPNSRRSMVVVPGFYKTREKNLARGSRATELHTDSIVSPVHSVPLAAKQVQPPIVTNSKEVVLTNSDSRSRVDSQTRVEVELVHETCELVEVQAPCLISGPQTVQGEYLNNQIEEIDRGLSCFDADIGVAAVDTELNVNNPYEQNLRSDVAPSFTLGDTNLNCFSATNNSLVVSGDVSDSGSLLGGGKVVTTRRRRVVRTVFDFIISNESGGTSRKCPSEENTLEELPRKRIVVS